MNSKQRSQAKRKAFRLGVKRRTETRAPRMLPANDPLVSLYSANYIRTTWRGSAAVRYREDIPKTDFIVTGFIDGWESVGP